MRKSFFAALAGVAVGDGEAAVVAMRDGGRMCKKFATQTKQRVTRDESQPKRSWRVGGGRTDDGGGGGGTCCCC